jgi:hypothetical protein
MRMASRSRSAASPDLPTAMTMRPQLASSPAIAVLTSGELAIAKPMRRAAPSSSAPVTVTVMNFSAPSPSRATSWASSRVTVPSALAKPARRRSDSPWNRSRRLPAAPVATHSTVSLVEVSPSTVMQLKLESTARASSACRTSAAGGIGEQEAEQRRHVGGDHAGALGEAVDRHLAPVQPGRGGCHLGKGIGGHDGARRLAQPSSRAAGDQSPGSAAVIGRGSSGSPITPVEAT